ATGIGVVGQGFLNGLAHTEHRRDVIVATGPSVNMSDALRTRQVSITRTRMGRLGFQRLLLPSYVRGMQNEGIAIDGVLLLDAYVPLFDRSTIPYTIFVHDTLPLTHRH